jgi:dTDP-glucose 4,6-dehydratase
MRYILLGGGGVFAIHTAKYLLEQPETEQLVSVGRNRERSAAFTLDVGKNDKRYSYKQIHIVFEQDQLFKLFDDIRPTVVINFAALAYATSWQNAYRYYDTNVVAVSKICEMLSQTDYLDRFVQIGTSELYGSSVDRPAKETDTPDPTSPYAVSKLAADLHLATLWKYQQFPMNIIRPSNCYGPGQLMYRILPKAVYCALTNQKLPLEGGGQVEKSFMHARDLGRAIHMIIKGAPLGRVYNAGPEQPCQIREIVEKVANISGVNFHDLVDIVPGRKCEDHRYWLDSSAITDEIDWRPEVDLTTGITEMVDWGRRYLDHLHDEEFSFTLHA